MGVKKFAFLSLLTLSTVVFFLSLVHLTALRFAGWGIFFLPVHGTVLGEFEGVTIHSAAGFNLRGEYGLEYQCVELINRFYAIRLGHKNMTKHGHADSYFWDSERKGLVAYENGGQEPPKKYDILVFDGGPRDGVVGHVALVTEVDHRRNVVQIVQQNTPEVRYGLFHHYRWQDELLFSRTSTGGWSISAGDFSIPIAGWSRQKEAQ
jgi:hypothetical protein